MVAEPMLTPREKSPLPEKKSPRRIEPTTLHQAGQQAQHTANELFWPIQYQYKTGGTDVDQSRQQLDTAPESVCDQSFRVSTWMSWYVLTSFFVNV